MTSDDDIDSLLRGVAAAPPTPPFKSLVGSKIGNYEITRLLGRGGMGAVYLGEHPLIGKKVAVKVLRDELAQDREIVARFFTEAKAVNDIHHENIVDIIDFGRSDERVYILMELLEGESLAARLNAGVPSTADTVHILRQAAGALAASHAKGIIHRDIKPDNIFLTRRSHDPLFVKLLDFGIVKLTGHASPWKTRTGAVIGTPLYMSPEQCAGHGRVDARSDIYSLGVVMYELITGRVPFLSSGLGDILRGHLNDRPAPPSTIARGAPAALEAIVMKCLEKDPGARFSSVGELRAALEGFGANKPPPLRRTTLSQSIGELIEIPRRRAPLVVVVGTLVAAVAVAVAVSRPTRVQEPVVEKREPAAHALPVPSPAATPIRAPAEPMATRPPEKAKAPRATKKPPAPRPELPAVKPPAKPAASSDSLDDGLL